MTLVLTDIQLLTTHDLLSLQPPRWLIQDVLPEGDYSVLWGPSRQGKSFVALDWSICLALGRPWQGRYTTRQGPVVYIAAEGGRGIQKRVKALMEHYQVTDVPGLYFLVKPLCIREPGTVEAFIDELEDADIWPALIVIDTLSRSFGGGEENSSADMGTFVDAMTRMASSRMMTVLIIHHANATGNRERGNTALKCGANAMFQCKGMMSKKGHLEGIIVSNDKQKDDAEAEDIYLRTEACGKSLVLIQEDMPAKVGKEEKQAKAEQMSKRSMVRMLAAAENGYTWEEWRLAAGIAKSSHSRRVSQLLKAGEVFKDEYRYYTYPATEDIAALEDVE